MKLGHWQKIQELHMYSLSTPGVKIEVIFDQWVAVSEMRADF